MPIANFKLQMNGARGARRLGLSIFLLAFCPFQFPAHADDARDALIVETLLKLERYDLSAVKPETRQAVLRHIDSHRGTQRFVELVERFDLRDRSDELLRMALDTPEDPAGISAARVLIGWGGIEELAAVIDGPDARTASAAIRVLGATNQKRALPLLASLVDDPQRSAAVRGDAVRGLGRGVAGERLLLDIARRGQLPDELKPLAASVLLISRDPSVREEAAKHLPAVGPPLPPIRELVRLSGDAERGAAVYMRATCITCHKAGEQGIDFGPALTEIGSKLSREALYEAIISPDAGISFGYEGVLVTTTGGQQFLGYIASETEEQIVLKQMGGVATTVRKADIRSRQPQTQSLMPPNLHVIMTTQELADLVEYLTTLRKK